MGMEWSEFKESRGTMSEFVEANYLASGTPVPSNILPLDDLLCGGFRPGLHVLGGEPGAGKSALGLFLSVTSSMSGAHVEYVSLEMSRAQCIERCLSLISHYTSGSEEGGFKWGDVWRFAQEARERVAAEGRECLETDPVYTACSKLERMCPGLVVSDSPTLHEISGMESELCVARSHGLDLAIVDYLQYITVHGVSGEYDRVSEASKRLNMLAVDLGVPIIAIASCSRAGVKTAGIPDMHSFKGSGDIEYHALSAMVIDRDPGGSCRDRRLHVVKNRFGGVTGEDSWIGLEFRGEYNYFELAR